MNLPIHHMQINLVMSVIYSLIIFSCFSLYYIYKLRPVLEGKIEDTEISKNTKKTAIIRFVISIVLCTVAMVVSLMYMTKGAYDIDEAARGIFFGISFSCFLTIAFLDVKFGEVYVYELGIANTIGLIILPILTNLVWNCPCISKCLAITGGIYIAIKFLNYTLNKEHSIGGADIDTLAALLSANIGIFFVIKKRENFPVFVYTWHSENLINALFYNFLGVLIVYFIYTVYKKLTHKDKKVEEIVKESSIEEINDQSVNIEETDQKSENEIDENQQIDNKNKDDNDNKEDKNKKKEKKTSRFKANFRCLPCFILLYFVTLFFLMFY